MQHATVADAPESVIDQAVVQVDAAGPNLAAGVERTGVAALVSDVLDEVVAEDVVVGTTDSSISWPPAVSTSDEQSQHTSGRRSKAK